MAELTAAMEEGVNSIWTHYEKDATEEMSREEWNSLLPLLYGEVNGETFSSADFDVYYNNIDSNESGTVDRDEMINHFVQVSLWEHSQREFIQ